MQRSQQASAFINLVFKCIIDILPETKTWQTFCLWFPHWSSHKQFKDVSIWYSGISLPSLHDLAQVLYDSCQRSRWGRRNFSFAVCFASVLQLINLWQSSCEPSFAPRQSSAVYSLCPPLSRELNFMLWSCRRSYLSVFRHFCCSFKNDFERNCAIVSQRFCTLLSPVSVFSRAATQDVAVRRHCLVRECSELQALSQRWSPYYDSVDTKRMCLCWITLCDWTSTTFTPNWRLKGFGEDNSWLRLSERSCVRFRCLSHVPLFSSCKPLSLPVFMNETLKFLSQSWGQAVPLQFFYRDAVKWQCILMVTPGN